MVANAKAQQSKKEKGEGLIGERDPEREGP